MSGSQSHTGGTSPGSAADPSMEDILASIRRILSEEEPSGSLPAGKAAAPVQAQAPAPTPMAEQAPPVLVLDNSMLVADPPPILRSIEPPRQPPPPVLRMEPPPVMEPPRQPPPPVLRMEPPPVMEPPPPLPRVEPPPPPPVLAPPPPPVLRAEPPPVEAPPPAPELTERVLSPEPMQPRSESFPMSASLSMSSSPALAAPETTHAAASSVTNLVRALTSDRGAQVSSGGPTIADIVREEMRPMLKSWLDTNLAPMVERMVRAEIDRVIARAQS